MQAYQAIEMHEKAAAVAQGLTVFLRISKTSNEFFTNNKDWRPLLLWGIGEQSRSCEPTRSYPLATWDLLIFTEVTFSEIKV
jgi:hypothetical protein